MSSIVQAIPFNSFAMIDSSSLDYMFSPLIVRVINQSQTKLPFNSFVEQIRLDYYPNEDFSFAPELMSWIGRDNNIFIPEYHLITYGIFSRTYTTNNIQKKVKELTLIKDYHYRIDTLTKKDNHNIKKEYGLVDPNSDPPTRGPEPSVYYFSPSAFKSILMSSPLKENHKYQNYFKLFETASVFYMRYELMLERAERDAAQAERDAAQSKVLTLESEKEDLCTKMDRMMEELSKFRSETSDFKSLTISKLSSLSDQNCVLNDNLQVIQNTLTHITKATIPSMDLWFRPFIVRNKILKLNHYNWNQDPIKAEADVRALLDDNKNSFATFNKNIKFMFVIPICISNEGGRFSMRYVFRVRNLNTIVEGIRSAYKLNIPNGNDAKKRYLIFKPFAIGSYELEVNAEISLWSKLETVLSVGECQMTFNSKRKTMTCQSNFRSRNDAYYHYTNVMNVLTSSNFINNPIDLYEGKSAIDDQRGYETIITINNEYDAQLREQFQQVLDLFMDVRSTDTIYAFKPTKHVFTAYEYSGRTHTNKDIVKAIKSLNYFIMTYIYKYANTMPSSVSNLLIENGGEDLGPSTIEAIDSDED